jgi:hypothetical protein
MLRRVVPAIVAVEKQKVLNTVNVCFLALGIQHAMRLRNIVMWPAPLYNTFPHYLINGTIFGEKKMLTRSVCFDFLYKVSLKHFLF